LGKGDEVIKNADIPVHNCQRPVDIIQLVVCFLDHSGQFQLSFRNQPFIGFRFFFRNLAF
jgi:hypothetical protein